MNQLDFSGRTAIVTGGSGGIGRAVARALAKEKAKVCVTYLTNEESAQRLIDELKREGAEAMAVRADLGKEDDVVRLFEAVDRTLGPLTALVNNAGGLGGEWRIDEVTAGRLAELWAVNITGYFLCSREAARRMSTRRGGAGGSIVNVSSMAGTRGGGDGRVAYGASKGAINALTLGLGRELAPEGIRVNAVLPGYVDTEFHAPYGGKEKLQRSAQSAPMKRPGRPEEVAEAVLWLLSGKSSFVTSTLLTVSGGA